MRRFLILSFALAGLLAPAVSPAQDNLAGFDWICRRERAPYAGVGCISDDRQLVDDSGRGQAAVDMPMDVLLGKPPTTHREVTRVARALPPIDTAGLELREGLLDLLRHPTVASKGFPVTIAERSVSGLNCGDPMVGPWQVPVADCAVTLADFEGYGGEAMAMGERTPVAVIDAAAALRLAIGEALTNLAAADIDLSRVKLSAN